VVEGDLNDRGFLRNLMRTHRADRIVFAAGPADVQRSFDDPATDFKQQLLPLLNVLEENRVAERPAGVVLVSSAAIYGNPTAIPVAETAAASPISPYGFHKLQQELLVDQYLALYGMPAVKARVFSTFGPGLRHLAVWDIARRAMSGQYGLWGTGRESRDYLHVTDIALALERIADRSALRGEVVNVASGRETPIARIAEIAFAELGVTEPPEFRGTELSGSPTRWRADISRLEALGFEATYTLERGLKETVDWIKSNA
jgi:nucleoside-diphosphate-sugar epimerase